MLKKLINEILEDCSIRGSLKYTREQNPILAICRQYLVQSIAKSASSLKTAFIFSGPTAKALV
jgi:hypothetical protein